MPLCDSILEQDAYQLIFVRSGSGSIWVPDNGGAQRLPRVSIRRWTRTAEQIQQAVETRWNQRAIVLNILPCEGARTGYAVVEILSPENHGNLVPACIDRVFGENTSREKKEVVEVQLAGTRNARM